MVAVPSLATPIRTAPLVGKVSVPPMAFTLKVRTPSIELDTAPVPVIAGFLVFVALTKVSIAAVRKAWTSVPFTAEFAVGVPVEPSALRYEELPAAAGMETEATIPLPVDGKLAAMVKVFVVSLGIVSSIFVKTVWFEVEAEASIVSPSYKAKIE